MDLIEEPLAKFVSANKEIKETRSKQKVPQNLRYMGAQLTTGQKMANFLQPVNKRLDLKYSNVVHDYRFPSIGSKCKLAVPKNADIYPRRALSFTTWYQSLVPGFALKKGSHRRRSRGEIIGWEGR